MTPHLPRAHFFLALAVMAVWGTNFVVIKLAVEVMPPLLLATLRFICVVLPAIFFIKRPQVPWRNLAAYGVLIGAGQFGLMFSAIVHDVTPGLASLLMQSQVFFTIAFSMWLTRERVQGYQVVALMIATMGIAIIVNFAGGSATPLGLLLVLGAAISWAAGNMVGRGAGQVDMLAYVIWSSLFAIPPLAIMALAIEGWPAIVQGVSRATTSVWLTIVWQAVGNAMFGYGVWGWLLARYPAATVAPMALMIPVFGMGASALYLGEALPLWKLGAAALVMAGLALNLFWPRLRARSALPV